MEYLLLILLWSLWCFFHSFLISPSVTKFFKDKLQKFYIYFRISYNIFASVSFVAVWFYARSLDYKLIFSPSGIIFYIQIIIFCLSILFFVYGTKNYDMIQFMGFRQLAQENSTEGIGRFGGFNQTGILQYTRHPWYLAIILILWTGYINLDLTLFIMNIIFTLYVVIGTILEEKKLVTEFGDIYREYQKKVPMFISLKSFKK